MTVTRNTIFPLEHTASLNTVLLPVFENSTEVASVIAGTASPATLLPLNSKTTKHD